MEPISIATFLASMGTLIAMVFDKMRNSRCTRIMCCCCEIEREPVLEE